MAGNSIGQLFKVSTFGESHGVALGGVVDGCPAGLEITEADLQLDLDRRKPGQSRFTTSNDKGGEKPPRRKTKGSYPMLIRVG